MTKQFSNVDVNGNIAQIGYTSVRVWETGDQHILTIGDRWFTKNEATVLRDWLNNVLQEEKPVTNCTHPLQLLSHHGAVSGIVNQFRCTACDTLITLSNDLAKVWQDLIAAPKLPRLDFGKPLYEHDCKECVYLGQFNPPDSDPKTYDLYIHKPENAKVFYNCILIARYGIDCDRISCSLLDACGHANGTPIYEALQRAKDRGLA